MKNVILSFASTYSYYELQPFVESWKENANDVEFYLFYVDLSEWTKSCLENMGVRLVEAPEKYKNEYLYNHGNVMYIRMRLFNEFLEKNPDQYESVLVADIRDVVFQHGLFSNTAKEDYLCFSSEGVPLINGAANSVWLTKLTGSDEWKCKFGNRDVINGGVYCGSVNEIIRYHKLLIDNEPADNFWGADQAYINFAVYSGLIKGKVLYSSPETGDMISVWFNRDAYKIENGHIVNRYGGEPHVVHQYDRVPTLVEFVNSRYRNEIFDDNKNYSDSRSVLELIRLYVLEGLYDKALRISFSLEKSVTIPCHNSIIFDVIKDIFSRCNTVKNDSNIPLVWQLVWRFAFLLFLNMSNEGKLSCIRMYLEWMKQSKFVNEADINAFIKVAWEMVKCNVEEKSWLNAHNLIRMLWSRMKELGSEFYVCASEVYRNLGYTEESIYLYSIGCGIQCNPIFYLETDFQSYAFEKNNCIQHVRVENPDAIIFEEVANSHPLCVMKKEQGCVLFVVVHGRLLYVQVIKGDGSIIFEDKPKIFEMYSTGGDKVSIKISDDGFLSARPNGQFGFAEWSRAWEQFRKVPCNVYKLYSLIAR